MPTNSKSKATFFLDRLKKLRKDLSTLSTEEMEDTAFIATLKAAVPSEKGSMERVKADLAKVASER